MDKGWREWVPERALMKVMRTPVDAMGQLGRIDPHRDTYEVQPS